MKLEELSSDSGSEVDGDEESWEDEIDADLVTASAASSLFLIPSLFTVTPAKDTLITPTSILQDETVEDVLPFLTATSGEFAPGHDSSGSSPYNKFGIPSLLREKHVAFLHKSLQDLPAAYTAADAARPWFFYWVICALATLGENVSIYKERLVSSVKSTQNPEGGFAGGHGQMSHLAPTYAIILALAMVGGDEAMECVDRKAMWHWIGRIKSSDGGFAMSIGGEEDVRGAYCATVVLSLLDLPLELPPDSPFKTRPEARSTDTLLTGLAEYVSRCQTFEGGISACPGREAHGAYAFCALGCLAILGQPHEIIPKNLDVPLLISWLSARQNAPEGGFQGRTNKLVDGCYSHWVGGCWHIIKAALYPSTPSKISSSFSKDISLDRTFYSREGLIRYIMCCCQDTSKRGGLRDKPSKYASPFLKPLELSSAMQIGAIVLLTS